MKFKTNHCNQTILGALMLAGIGACSSGSSIDPTLVDGDPTTLSFQVKAARTTGTAATNALVRAETSNGESLDLGAVDLSSVKLCVKEIRLKKAEDGSCQDQSSDDSNSTDDTPAVVAKESADDSANHDEFECEDGNGEDHLKLAGPFVFDLLNGTATPDVSTLSIPSGAYRELELRLSNDCTELNGATYAATGTLTANDNSVKNIELRYAFHESISLKLSSTFSLAELKTNELIVKLNADKWLDGVNLADCHQEGNVFDDNGTLSLSDDHGGSGSCSGIENTIRDNIEKSFELDDSSDDSSSEDDSSEDNSSVSSLLVRCETRSDRSKISIDTGHVAAGTYKAVVTSGGNSAEGSLTVAEGGELEFDFDSDAGDIAEGSVAIASNFISGSVVAEIFNEANVSIGQVESTCVSK